MTDTAGARVFRKVPLASGLHLVATPIGAARDITLRALDVLASAEVLAAEDTRTLKHLLDLHGVPIEGRTILAYHDRNGAAQRPRLLGHLADGRSIAYASDAGTPLVADPGFQLARAAIALGHDVHAVPGPSAVLASLTLAGLPTDRFMFAGFPPPSGAARTSWLSDVLTVRATLVLFEAPRRVGSLLSTLIELGAGARAAALCREITKRFEEVRRGPLESLAESVAADAPRGEIVLVLGPPEKNLATLEEIDEALQEALKTMRLKDAATEVARKTGGSKREIYQRALTLKDEPE
ncbi:MAG: 16S rRNA (cytidine(1402)-2'-O)-methyltransferase [Pseudomonadota bacterium]